MCLLSSGVNITLLDILNVSKEVAYLTVKVAAEVYVENSQVLYKCNSLMGC